MYPKWLSEPEQQFGPKRMGHAHLAFLSPPAPPIKNIFKKTTRITGVMAEEGRVGAGAAAVVVVVVVVLLLPLDSL